MRCTKYQVVANEREGSSRDSSRSVTDSHDCRRRLEESDRRDSSICTVGTQHYEAWTTPGRQAGIAVGRRRESEVREKKSLYHVFLGERTADNWRKYQEAKKAAQNAVAVAKAIHYGDVNEKPESRDGELSVAAC
ncbi:unnamed protein product [Heligmosomoides polygyrus]|uniref:AP2/ERF domain-containing protein n=1 Tax=Heligmosomoides polygyrus TaxID=6339 RepID=A0A183GSV0_HELPZ|nr:unnamed protein product [Heligmosomoides polygyrus]